MRPQAGGLAAGGKRLAYAQCQRSTHAARNPAALSLFKLRTSAVPAIPGLMPRELKCQGAPCDTNSRRCRVRYGAVLGARLVASELPQRPEASEVRELLARKGRRTAKLGPRTNRPMPGRRRRPRRRQSPPSASSSRGSSACSAWVPPARMRAERPGPALAAPRCVGPRKRSRWRDSKHFEVASNANGGTVVRSPCPAGESRRSG